MTWTPGLVLDYARALQRVVEPPRLPWPLTIGGAILRLRDARRLRFAEVPARADAVSAAIAGGSDRDPA